MPTRIDHYITLGRSGLRVSPLCLGAMTFGEEWGMGANESASHAVLTAYLERGGNFIDTANVYNKGHSEVIIGNYFAPSASTPFAGKRDRFVIATKWLGNLFPGDPNGGGAHRKAVLDSVEHSLRRLRTDYIDLYWMHFWDGLTPIDETMRALDDLVSAGKVRYIGFSDTPAWKCAQAQMIAHFRNWSPLIALQIEYSLIERTVEFDLIPMAQELGMGVTPWSPLKGGILTGKYTRAGAPDHTRYASDSKHLNDRTFAILDELQSIAAQHDTTPAQVALAWVRDRRGVSSTIIGARTTEQLEANLTSLRITLTPDQTAALDEKSAPNPIFPHSFLPLVIPAIQNRTTINGRSAEPWKLSPASDDDRW